MKRIPEDVPVLERVKISRADDVIDVEDISPIDAEKSPEAAAIKEARRLTRETKKELTELGAILQSPEFKAKKNALNKKVKIPGDISDIGRKEIETRNESNRAEVDGAEARYAALQNLYIQQLEDGLSKLQAIKPSDLEEQSKDKTYDAVKAEWYYRHIESNWLSELYTQKLKQSYTSHYKVRGAEGAVARTWTSTKNFFGFKPELNEIGEGLEALHEREQVAQARQYEFAEKLMDAKKVTTSKDLTVSEVPKLIDEYRATLDRTLVVNRMRERHNIQKEAFANITDRESTVKNIILVLQKNKWKMRAAKVVAYGVIGGATGGIGAAVLGAGSAGLRTAAGVVGGVAGGRFGRGVGAVGVERAQVKLKEIETKKLESLTAEMLSERRAKLIAALTEEDAAKRDQKIYQVIGAVAGGGLAAAYAPDVSQYVQAKFSAPPDIPDGATTAPLPSENPVAMEPLPELPNSSFSVPESITPETLPPLSDVAEVPVPQAETPDLAALRAMTEQGVTKGDLEADFAAAPIPEPVEVVPEVTTVLPADEGHILTLEEVMNRPLIPQPDAALVPEVPHTPLDYTSAERLAEQEHLFRLGDQFGKGTVSEQIYEAWKNGDLEHLQWVPSPDEMSHQEFLAAMNQYIDPNSPDFMSPEEIKSMDIESGDFTKMPYGDEYDALPLLDKMFPSHAPIALETMLPPENEFVGEAFVLPGASTAEFPSGSIAFQADEIRPSSEEVVGVPYATQSTETGVPGEVVAEGRPLARVAVTRPAVVGGVTSSPEIPSAVSPDPVTEVAADIPARGGDTFANAPAGSSVSLETFQKPGFHTQVVEYVRSEVQDLPGVSADKVMQEIENRSTELFGADETVDVAAIKDFVHGVTHREYVLNALTPVTADDATNVLFNKVFSEMTFAEMTNDIESTNSITKDLFVKYELAQGAESAHSLSELITYTLTTFGHDTSLTIAGRMEELFQNGDLTFSTDHGSILDKHGAVVFTFAS